MVTISIVGFWCSGFSVYSILVFLKDTINNKFATKPELRFCADSNPTCGVLEIHNVEDL